MGTRDAFTLPWIAPGAHVRVIAPSSPFEADAFHRGVERLRKRYTVSFDEALLTRTGYLAGHDNRRLAELCAAIDDPHVDGIVAARGGYGATRFLHALDTTRVTRRPKLLVGFSDVTALHALWTRAAVASLHGPMAATLGRLDETQLARWFDAVEGRFPASHSGLAPLHSGRASGILVGGNLTVLTALCGTPHMPSLANRILFLEDTGERPYRIDRMLTTLRDSRALDGVAGVVLGAFTQCEPGADGTTVLDVLRERFADLNVPVAHGLPCGHVDDNHELPFGTHVELDADRGMLQLCEPFSST